MEDGRCKVLIVDDETLIREGIKHFIDWGKEGFTVVGEAANGQEALELVEATRPHIILTDIVMPIMDGEELTKRVKESFPETQIIILSSYGEFNYVRSAFQSGVVDYILKPKLDAAELLAVLKAAAERIPGLRLVPESGDAVHQVRQWFGQALKGFSPEADQPDLSAVLSYNRFRLFAIRSDGEPLKELEEKIIEEAGEAVCLAARMDKDVTAFLVNADSAAAARMPRMIQELFGNEQAWIAAGECFRNVGSLPNAVKELKQLVNARFYFPENHLLSAETLPAVAGKKAAFNLDWFTGECKRRQFERAFHYLEEHAEELAKTYTMEVYEFKNFFGNIIFNVTLLLGNMGYSASGIEGRKHAYLIAIDQARTAAEVLAQLKKFRDEVEECVRAGQAKQENLNMNQLLDYIKAHYSEPLTLTDVARHFHFNPSYLSSYFSSRQQESFVEYINRIRIEEAERLLLESGSSIAEISGMVGFSDHSYFCKVFKKLTGLSPSQYRRKQISR